MVEALAALGVIEVLGYVATPWRSTRVGDLLELVDRNGGRLAVRWTGDTDQKPSLGTGTLAEMTGRWRLVDQQLVLDVNQVTVIDRSP